MTSEVIDRLVWDRALIIESDTHMFFPLQTFCITEQKSFVVNGGWESACGRFSSKNSSKTNQLNAMLIYAMSADVPGHLPAPLFPRVVMANDPFWDLPLC